MVRLDAVTRSGRCRASTSNRRRFCGVRLPNLSPPGLETKRHRGRTSWVRLCVLSKPTTLYECRGRNRVPGAKLSEHGKGNAVDLRSFILADGRVVTLTDVTVAKDFRDELRESACHRFTTVLGPGSDSAHESHIHVDLIERRGGYRMCQWDVRTPPTKEVAAGVPLPTPRPNIDRSTASRKM